MTPPPSLRRHEPAAGTGTPQRAARPGEATWAPVAIAITGDVQLWYRCRVAVAAWWWHGDDAAEGGPIGILPGPVNRSAPAC